MFFALLLLLCVMALSVLVQVIALSVSNIKEHGLSYARKSLTLSLVLRLLLTGMPILYFATPAKAVNPIQHVVVITGENRSFDELFGMMPGVNGFTISGGIPIAQHAASVNMPCPGNVTTGTCTVNVVHRNPLFTSSDCNHFRAGSVIEVDGGNMDGFTNGNAGSAGYTGNNGVTSGQFAKICYEYFTGADLTTYWKYATYWGLNDNTYSDLLGPSYPNHGFMIAAITPAEVADNPDAKAGSTGAVAASWTCQANAAQQRTVSTTNWTLQSGTTYSIAATNNLVGSGSNQSTIHFSGCATATALNNGNFAVSATGLSTSAFQLTFGSNAAYDATCVLTNLNSGQASGASGVAGLVPNVYITNSGTDPAVDTAITVTPNPTVTFSSVTVNSPIAGQTTYTSSTSIGGSGNTYLYTLLTVSGMQNSTNNVLTQYVLGSTDTTVTVATTTQTTNESGSSGTGLIGPGIVVNQGASDAPYSTGVCGGHCVGGTNQFQYCLNNSACPSSTCSSLINPTYPTACTTLNQSTSCTGTSTCQFSLIPG